MIKNDCECLFENDMLGNNWFYDCDKIAGHMIVDGNKVYDEDVHVTELNEVYVNNKYIKYEMMGGDQVQMLLSMDLKFDVY